ncbi:hypothetical protein DFH08DRAFT_945361 [Mycena albidolilacea]|uniref:Uncharacterized protein n=1 Tax=Mycena albidolilacea TaxID=1033008 RepID=A0AAD6Z2A3_9AGAR|nr:hypothetical protein DFH08DRAFT_945361 [Mycena albidolilacea]
MGCNHAARCDADARGFRKRGMWNARVVGGAAARRKHTAGDLDGWRLDLGTGDGGFQIHGAVMTEGVVDMGAATTTWVFHGSTSGRSCAGGECREVDAGGDRRSSAEGTDNAVGAGNGRCCRGDVANAEGQQRPGTGVVEEQVEQAYTGADAVRGRERLGCAGGRRSSEAERDGHGDGLGWRAQGLGSVGKGGEARVKCEQGGTGGSSSSPEGSAAKELRRVGAGSCLVWEGIGAGQGMMGRGFRGLAAGRLFPGGADGAEIWGGGFRAGMMGRGWGCDVDTSGAAVSGRG